MQYRPPNANIESGSQTVYIVSGDNGCRHLFRASKLKDHNDGHAIAKSRRSSMWDHCVPYGVFLWRQTHTLYFFNHNAICERF